MQWLNTFDEVLEKALKTPQQKREPEDPPSTTEEESRLAVGRADSPSTLSEDGSLPLLPTRYVLPSAPLSLPGSIRRTKPSPGRLKRSPLPGEDEDVHDDDKVEDEDDGSSGREIEEEEPTMKHSSNNNAIKKPVMRLPSHDSQLSRTSSGKRQLVTVPPPPSLQAKTLFHDHERVLEMSNPPAIDSSETANFPVEVTEMVQPTPASEESSHPVENNDEQRLTEQQQQPAVTTALPPSATNSVLAEPNNHHKLSSTVSSDDARTDSSAEAEPIMRATSPLNSDQCQLNVVESNSSNVSTARRSTTPISAPASLSEKSLGTQQEGEVEESFNGDVDTGSSDYEDYETDDSSDDDSDYSVQEKETFPAGALSKGEESRSGVEALGNGSLPPIQPDGRDLAVTAPILFRKTESDLHDSLLSSRSLPRQVELRSEFDVGELRPSWATTSEGPFDIRNNCYGVFSVRVLRAQRLPCSVGSSVQAVVSLLPWDGKVRTQQTQAFSAKKARYGVCARWGEEVPPISMVHAYSSEETPVPTIRIELVFKLVFEFTICSLELPCQELMAAPSFPKRQWFAAAVGDKKLMNDVLAVPILEIEAMFEPSEYNRELNGADPIERSDVVPMESIDFSSVCSSLNEEVVTLPTPTFCSPGTPPRHTKSDDISLSHHSIIKSAGKNLNSTPHMLHAAFYWTPATCCVCKRSILSGLSKARSFHCEACSIDCCNDCRLQVDIQLPCGSTLAARARSKAIQNKLTMQNIMSTIAPVPMTADETTMREEDDGSVEPIQKADTSSIYSAALPITAKDEKGIGSIKFDFVRALVYETPIPADSDPGVSKDDVRVRKGDYYIRVSRSGGTDSKRTRTMQNTGRPKFDSVEIKFIVPHYGIEFRVEIVDATTNKSIGAGIITTQSLLQRQRDALVEKRGFPLLLFLGAPTLEAQHFNLELRSGIKTSADFFSPSKAQTGSAGDKARVGDIVGSIELRAMMMEDVSSLFGQRPYECPPRPPDPLNMALFGVHLTRLYGLIEDFRKGFQLYVYVVSWKNPVITLASLVLFVQFCVFFDLEYIGSVPLFFLIVWMLFLAFSRCRGSLKNRLIDKEVEEYTKTVKVAIDRTLHRPAGKITVGVECGRNLRSTDLGLPGIVGCRVYWDPIRYLDGDRNQATANLDKASNAAHEVGATNYLYSMHPSWGRLEASDEAKRLKHLLPSTGDGEFFEGDTDQKFKRVDFPILQPLSRARDGELLVLNAWGESPGAIVFDVRFQDAISLLPGSEYSIGEVVIPFSKLTRHKEISGWFKVLEAGTTRMIALVNGTEGEDVPQINIRVRWAPPVISVNGPSETEREASYVIQEELVRSTLASKDQKLGLVGTSLGAINTVRGLSEYLLIVQNTLGSILDLIGSARSAFNFSDPYRSTLLFFAIFSLWVVLVIIPTRVLILFGGLAQYTATFLSKFGHIVRKGHGTPPQEHRAKATRDENPPSSPYATWIINAIRGFPTDEDIRKTYFWECRRLRAQKSTEIAESKRNARLQRLWRAQFYASVSILNITDQGRSDRMTVFAMIQGRRFLWWSSVEAFDSGEEPLGLIFLSGHAGLATPSPLELRSIDKEELSRVACIFGRGRETQERVTIVTPSDEVTVQLEHAVSFATSAKKD